MKQDCNIADGVLRGVVRRLYQGAFFFFQNVIEITFTLTVFCADFKETHQFRSLIRFPPKRNNRETIRIEIYLRS